MKFRQGEALRPHNTLALKAKADAFVTVANDVELSQALVWARERHLPVIPLGEGSNIVFAGDLHALVVRQDTRGIDVVESGAGRVTLRVAAGENWHSLVQWTLQNGYYGLENLALIPGTVGAAPIQNIGAYGVELKSVLLRVHARLIENGRGTVLDNVACEFAYRDSIFKHDLRDRLLITAVDLQLSLKPEPNITYPALQHYFREHPSVKPAPQAIFDALVSIRRSKLPDPSREPNAGSFFKNPMLPREQVEQLLENYPALPCFPQSPGRVKVSAAWMIDQCGWKGFRRNDLGVHGQHALVLVNYGNGSGEQLLSLASDVATSVFQKFGVHLEIEPRIYGSGT